MNCEGSEELSTFLDCIRETFIPFDLVLTASIRLSPFAQVLTRCFCAALPLVGPNGLEPSTSRLSGVRSNHLSYEPICAVIANRMVEMVGVEPMTSCLQGRRSPN